MTYFNGERTWIAGSDSQSKKKLTASSFIFFGRLGVGTFHLTRAAGLQALSRAEMLLQVHFHNPIVLHLLFAFTHKLVVVTKKKLVFQTNDILSLSPQENKVDCYLCFEVWI